MNFLSLFAGEGKQMTQGGAHTRPSSYAPFGPVATPALYAEPIDAQEDVATLCRT